MGFLLHSRFETGYNYREMLKQGGDQMLFIFCAMYPEAAPIISALGLKAVAEETVFRVFRSEDTVLAVIGMGKVSAASSVSYIISRYGTGDDRVLNAGICACPDRNAKGRIFIVNKLTDNDTGRDLYPDMVYETGLPEKPLVTFSRLVTAEDMEGTDFLYDMEGSAVFEAVNFFMGPDDIALLKVVSDAGDVSGLTAPVVSKLMEDVIDDIVRVTGIIRKEKETSDDEELKSLSEDLKCTEYMKNRLSEIYRYMKAEGIDIRALIDRELPVKDKKEGNEVIDDLLSHLR